MADLTNLAAYLPDAKAQISLRSAPIVGNSFGGIVVSVGPDVFTFIVGDKVRRKRHNLDSGDPKAYIRNSL